MSISIPKKENPKPKRILLGVTGGIAAYKSCLLLRRLIEAGHEVRVVMSHNATRFVAPLTFSTLSGHPVPEDPFLKDTARTTEHIDHSLWADHFVVAPATANILGKTAGGIADDFLSTLLCAFDGPILFAPAMNHRMWKNPAVQRNVSQLQMDGHLFVEPGDGYLACGETGAGRMAEPEEIHAHLDILLNHGTSLAGKRVLVTAGPTVEDLDEVRFLSNRSTGKMGFALARAAQWLGAEVQLIAGPVNLPTPPGVCRRNVRSAEQMRDAVHEEHGSCDILIMTAAVADYCPDYHEGKRKKEPGDWSLTLRRTTDILASLADCKQQRLHVGFALEVENEKANAVGKLKSKGLDMICLNNPRDEGAGFGGDSNRITLLDVSGGEEALPMALKQDLALLIMQRIAERVRA